MVVCENGSQIAKIAKKYGWHMSEDVNLDDLDEDQSRDSENII